MVSPLLKQVAVGVIAVALAVTVHFAQAASGRFIGELILKMGPEERDATLVKEFGFIDPEGREWKVPAKTVVNGASIPRPLWSIIGSPWTGKYRRASVIHDYFCDTKDRGWRNVHRVFYDGMMADGVGTYMAKLMYAAVLNFGPKWKMEYGLGGTPKLITWQPPFDQKRLDELKEWVKQSDPSLEQIDALVQ